MPSLRVFSQADIRQALHMPAAIAATAAAFRQLAANQATIPLRNRIELPDHQAVSLFMPAYLPQSTALGIKLVSVFPQNPERYGLPSLAAVLVMLDSTTGQPVALLDATYLTAVRTGAAPGVATQYMARADARVLALFGAGAMAPDQARAVCAVRSIERIWLVNRTPANAARLRERLLADPAIAADIQIATTPAQALAEADIISCATGAPEPLFAAADVRPGTHINAIGSHEPHIAEVPPATVAQARVVVDHMEAAWAEAGDVLCAQAQGLITTAHVVAELGQVVAGEVAGRTTAAEITFFKSVGVAVQDMAVAQLAFERALALGLGTEVSL